MEAVITGRAVVIGMVAEAVIFRVVEVANRGAAVISGVEVVANTADRMVGLSSGSLRTIPGGGCCSVPCAGSCRPGW